MAVTINYYWPVATPGTTTPAPSNQAVPTIPTPPATSRFNSVTATITDDGATTSAVIVTNFGLTAGELTALWPKVNFEPTIPGGFNVSGFYVAARASNSVTVGFSPITSGVVIGVVRVTRPIAPER